MKRLFLISLFFLLVLSTVSYADDVEVFGTVKSNVAPNVLFILDNSVSMKRIEGPVGIYDNTIEYEGKFDKNKFYYRWGYKAVKGLEPLALRHADIENISCTEMKSALQSSGYWKGTAYVYPGKDFRCEGKADNQLCSIGTLPVGRAFYKGNYLNWYYYNVFEDKYETTKTYIGPFASGTIYKDEDSDSALAKIKERPDAFKMGFEDANIASISEGDKSISDSLKSTGYWSGDLYVKEGVFYSSCEGAGGNKVLGVCQPMTDILTFLNQAVYFGNYLNWFFNRTTVAYNAETKYPGGFAANRFYYISSSKTPVKDYSSGVPTTSADAIECESIKTAMTQDHFWSGETCAGRTNLFDPDTAYFKCSNDVDRLKDYNFYSGNYLNYFYEKRMGVAKRVMKNVLETRTDIRMGLMTFNDYVEAGAGVFEDGGKVDAFISDDSTEFLRALSSARAITRPHSPLAETLAEAGRYFAGINGKCSNDSSARPFTSPITHWCQSNHVIIISDGSSFADADYNLWLRPYICTSDWDNDPTNDYIGDYDKDHKEWAIFGNYLDDVAKYLYDNDIYRDRLFQTPHPANKKTKQNVITHTVGFMVSGIGDILTTRKGLLRNTASQGGGSYQEVTSSADLDEKLRSSINSVLNNVLSTQNFVTPSVPVSSESQSFSGDYYYLAMFYPQSQGRWEGNLKKYETKSYMAMDKEIWTNSTSKDFKDGGVKEKLKTMNSSDRKIYFGNEMKEFNSVNVTKAMTGGGDNAWSDSDHAKLLSSIKCGNSGDGCSTGKLGDYALGDIIHFTPLFQSFKNGQLVNNRIFVGANDGMLHCIDDATGLEKWAFIPGEQISRLKYLIPEGHKSSQVLSHEYYIDGGRTMYETPDKKKLLIFGERRGGKNYYALDVSSPDLPVFKYKVSVDDDFGQSWSSLRVVPVMYDRINKKDIFWIGGGYDAGNQDKYDKQNLNTKPKDRDDLGKGIYAVDAGTGQILVSLEPSGLNNCIIEPVSFNPGYEASAPLEDGQKINDLKDAHSRVYACDMAGNLWGGRQDTDEVVQSGGVSTHLPGAKGGDWSSYKIFTPKKAHKVFGKPEVVIETFIQPVGANNPVIQRYYGEYIYFGTGDREHPSALSTNGNSDTVNPEDQDRFYAVKNYWNNVAADENSLRDVTDDQIASPDLSKFENRGWFIRLKNNGEKAVSTPLAYRGMLFFTTYTPPVDSHYSAIPADPDNGESAIPSNQVSTDLCSGENSLGTARLYAVNYKTGAAILDLSVKGVDKDGHETSDTTKITGLSTSDRSLDVGKGIPGSPQLIFPSSGGTKLVVTAGDDIYTMDLEGPDMILYYWREKK